MRLSYQPLIGCLLILLGLPASATIRYVNLANRTPVSPYTDWSTAATNIQDAVDAAVAGDEVVVTNGIYRTGGRVVAGSSLTNRVAVTKALNLRSLNGPVVTVITGSQVPGTTNGDSAIRCVYLTNGASMLGFTLIFGATRSSGPNPEMNGGGVFCATAGALVSNCVLTVNSAYYCGGGAFSGTLSNCTLIRNSAEYGGGSCSNALFGCLLASNTASFTGGGAFYCTLADCTLTGNLANYDGGGAYYGTLTNCTLATNSANYYAGGAYFGTLANCTLLGNSAGSGGGVYFGTLANCTLAGNSAGSGGGVYCAALTNCTLTSNSASLGAGVYAGTLAYCTLKGNSASSSGGGAYSGTLANCTLIGNSAGAGGGSCSGTLVNCALTGNLATNGGGGCYGLLANCTLTGNQATSGGGVYSATLFNCIVYYNTASDGNYDSSSSLDYCCTTPLPASGSGNLSADPQLASTSHISANSLCRAAGSADHACGLDIDGEPWANPPSIGCDQYSSEVLSGALTVGIAADYTNVAVGFNLNFQAPIAGRASASSWDFGDGAVASNRPYASHAWLAPGDYPVQLRAYNQDYPAGVLAAVIVHVVAQPVHYVALSSASPVAPYATWATAATNIQDAVDAATLPGALVLVSNGVYQTGARVVYGMSNRVAVTKALVVRSVNGSGVTSISGYQVPGTTNGAEAIRCAYLTSGAILGGFALTNGATQTAGDSLRQQSGGGVWCESESATVSNCAVTGNSAYYGGGAYSGTLANCTLAGNSACFGGGTYYGMLTDCNLVRNSAAYGGGAYSGMLANCTLTGNSAACGGGANNGTLANCTLRCNTASDGGGGAYGGTLANCTLTSNSADSGGGAYYGTLANCTLMGNSASSGGGVYFGTLV